MYFESKRVFITDLPEELNNEDVTKRFSKYGTVSSVEIKERKDLGPKNNSRFFAFVNIQIDAGNLQKCFQEIASKKWKGEYVQLQLARENFLERLKKEREEAQQNSIIADPLPTKETDQTQINFNNSNTKIVAIKKKPVESSTDSCDSDDDSKSITPNNKITKHEVVNGFKESDNKYSNIEEFPDIVYKNNKSKIVNNKLVIESVGNKPIFTSKTNKSKSLDPKRAEADQKRIQSLLEKRHGFNRQKLVIKSALAKIDISSVVHHKSNEYAGPSKSQEKASKKPKLFENDEEDEEEYNFNLKKQYEGAGGQKLLALQSNYKNDDRFTLDERFMDQEEEVEHEHLDEDDLVAEKKKEYEIMEEVLGTKITSNLERPKNKMILRFDPNQPEHSKYEIKENDVEGKPTKKRKKEKAEVVLPEVSQETFFDVDAKLKDALEEKSSFSLLGMFGQPLRTDADNEKGEIVEPSSKIHKKNSLLHTENPFKYDSSDDENDATVNEDVKSKKSNKIEKTNSATVTLGAKRLWTETLFFKEDDYRFQDGMEFVMKLGTENTGGISQVRQEIKQIVRAKVRNNKGKDKMFKKKLGGQSKFKFRKGHKKH